MAHSRGPGHLFVVQGDLAQINVASAIVPCDKDLNVTPGFADLLGDSGPGDNNWLRPAGVDGPMGTGRDRAPCWLPERGDRRVGLVNTTLPHGGDPDSDDLDWLIAGLANAVREATKTLPPSSKRERPLIGMPLVGAGEGGFASRLAEVLKRLMADLDGICSKDGGPDIVLVLRHRSDYAAVQNLRPYRSRHPDQVERLAQLARAGRLVPFFGAGLSMGAGLPSWQDLLDRVAKAAQINEKDLAAVRRLQPEDQAEAIGRRLREQGKELYPEIVEAVSAPMVSLAHCELASMRFAEAITTNYDTLYERACDAAWEGGRVSVIPGKGPDTSGPWLVKMHGDIEVPKSLVLTRGQYLAFDSHSVPLASLVQAHMVTHHLMFIGYSLQDGNFIRFVQQVRRLFEAYGQEDAQIGTVLTLGEKPELAMLWGGGFSFVALGPEGRRDAQAAAGQPNLKAQARELEIFLDNVAQRACDDASYFLDPRYGPLLKPGEKELAAGLLAVADAADAAPAGSPAGSAVRELLKELGWRDQ